VYDEQCRMLLHLLLLTVFVDDLRFHSPPIGVKTLDETIFDIIFPRKYGKYIIK
jgi:hypothetical protein